MPVVRQLPSVRALIGISLPLLIAACDPTVPPVPLAEPSVNVQQYVSGNASADLDPSGRFRTAGQPPSNASGITPGRARQIALAYAERFGSGLRGPLFREHGGAIDFSVLKAAERSYFAHTPYDSQPAGTHPGMKKRYGPYYIVRLYEDSRPVLAAAVSVSSSDFKEDESGVIRFFDLVGNDVLLYGLRSDLPVAYPISPEEAVAVSYRATGVKTVEVPQLVLEPEPMSPFSARWRITLERSLTFSGVDGNAYSTADVFVGHRRTLSVGVAQRPVAHLASRSRKWTPVRDGQPAGYVDVRSSSHARAGQ